MPQLQRIQIEGYRPFRRLELNVDSLQLFVGSNGSGKSSLFEFLRVLRDGMEADIPPAIAPGAAGKSIFHAATKELALRWSLRFQHPQSKGQCLQYDGELLGPVGQVQITEEFVRDLTRRRGNEKTAFNEDAVLMEMRRGKGELRSPKPAGDDGGDVDWQLRPMALRSPRRLALGKVQSILDFPETSSLANSIANWTFIDGLHFDLEAMRQPTTIEQDARLAEDGANLSAVLFQLQSEHPEIFERVERRMHSFVSSFGTLHVKAQGAPGQVLAFVKEPGLDQKLSLGDLSDGILRLLALTVLCYQPKPPPLVCIDEPVQGVHPKTVPILAGMFQKLATRTQVFLITHSPYFLSQFDVQDIVVFTRRDGQTLAHLPADSQALIANLDEFGTQELRQLHRTNELAMLSPPVKTKATDEDADESNPEEGLPTQDGKEKKP